MPHQICVINGHPDPSPERLVHALCDAYTEGAISAGHDVDRIDVGALDFDYLGSAAEFETPPPEPIASVRGKIAAAEHVFLAFPLWLGSMPAKARGFFEQVGRGHFYLAPDETGDGWPRRMMKGKSMRIVVTMGMPGMLYKVAMDAGSLKALERGMFGISGFKPIHHSIFGGVDTASEAKRASWFTEMRELGEIAH